MFEKHIFICNNERAPSANRDSCGSEGNQIRVELARLIHEYGVRGKVRANKCGCLDACELGPVVVIYPQNIWYGNVKAEDAEEIFKQSIQQNQIVQRLLIKPNDWENRK